MYCVAGAKRRCMLQLAVARVYAHTHTHILASWAFLTMSNLKHKQTQIKTTTRQHIRENTKSTSLISENSKSQNNEV